MRSDWNRWKSLALLLRDLALVARTGRETGNRMDEVDAYIPRVLFSTLTNVNCDPDYFVHAIDEICRFRDEYKSMIENTGHQLSLPPGPASFNPPANPNDLLDEAQKHGLKD